MLMIIYICRFFLSLHIVIGIFIIEFVRVLLDFTGKNLVYGFFLSML